MTLLAHLLWRLNRFFPGLDLLNREGWRKETLMPRFGAPLRLARDQDGSVFRAQPRFDALDQPLPQ